VPEWIDRVLAALSGVKQPGYYVKMAVGWALSVCYVKFPNQTFPYLTGNEIDPETRKKALQKITESRRISGEQRELIRRMRREIS
ncbi:MAG: DNA alkylation repair protein, partial [Massilimaliae sp.]|nr:DNA alkylation repair protein [Massiliimalia sp.]